MQRVWQENRIRWRLNNDGKMCQRPTWYRSTWGGPAILQRGMCWPVLRWHQRSRFAKVTTTHSVKKLCRNTFISVFAFVVIMDHSKTTIQVSDSTLRMLVLLRRRLNKSSYDEVLQEILPSHLGTPFSLAGAFPALRWLKKDRLQTKGKT